MAALKARAQMKWSRQRKLDEGMSHAVMTSLHASRDHDGKRTHKSQAARSHHWCCVQDCTLLRTSEQSCFVCPTAEWSSRIPSERVIPIFNAPPSRYPPASAYFFFHSHGGTGCRSAHNPFCVFLASVSNPSSTVLPGAYFRYHQHQPSLTNV